MGKRLNLFQEIRAAGLEKGTDEPGSGRSGVPHYQLLRTKINRADQQATAGPTKSLSKGPGRFAAVVVELWDLRFACSGCGGSAIEVAAGGLAAAEEERSVAGAGRSFGFPPFSFHRL